MIDTSRRGRRCRAKKMVRTHEAKIEPERRGTIVHELENLGDGWCLSSGTTTHRFMCFRTRLKSRKAKDTQCILGKDP